MYYNEFFLCFQGNSDSSNYSSNLLTKDVITTLRSKAILTCGENISDENSYAKCNPLESPCLFNLREDPCERINLAAERPLLLLSLENALVRFKKEAREPQNVPSDDNADPRKYNNTWVPWQDCEEIHTKHIGNLTLTPTAIAVLATLCTLFLIVVIILVALSVKSKMKKTPSSDAVYNEDTLDAPTSVVHVKTESQAENNEGFENSEHVRQNSLRIASKSID